MFSASAATARGSRSTKVACAAPRESASSPTPPAPANRSSTRASGKRGPSVSIKRDPHLIGRRTRRRAPRRHQAPPLEHPGDDPHELGSARGDDTLAGRRERELAAPAREQQGRRGAPRCAGSRSSGSARDDRRWPRAAPPRAAPCRAGGRRRGTRGVPDWRVPKNSPGPRSSQIDLGDPEAVVRRRHRVDPPLGVLAEVAAGQQDAVRLPLRRGRRARGAGGAARARSARRARSA